MACKNDYIARKSLDRVRLQAVTWSKMWKVDVIIFIEEIVHHGNLYCFEEVGKKVGRKGIVETIRYADVRDDKSQPVLQVDENTGIEPSDNSVGEDTVAVSRGSRRKVD